MLESGFYNMDCMDAMREFPDKFFELCICDPPYGIGMDGGNVGYKGKNNLAKKQWDKATPDAEYFQELFRISENQIIWGGNYFELPPTRCFLIWDKGAGFKGRTYAECELAWTSFNANAFAIAQDDKGVRVGAAVDCYCFSKKMKNTPYCIKCAYIACFD